MGRGSERSCGDGEQGLYGEYIPKCMTGKLGTEIS